MLPFLSFFEGSSHPLIPLEEVDTVGAALEPADADGALGQVEIVPPQVAGLAHPEPVAIDQQTDQPIAMTVPVGLQRSQELGHLGFGEVFTGAIGIVRLASLRCNWSHNRSVDQLEVSCIHWISARCECETDHTMAQNVTSHRD
jgi:hypothetical protein